MREDGMLPISDKLIACCVPKQLPKAEIISRDENGWAVEAEVFGTEIEM